MLPAFFALMVGGVLMLGLGLSALTTMAAGSHSVSSEQRLAQSSNLLSGVVASVDPGNLMIIMRTRFGQAQAFTVSSAEVLKGISQGDTITVELDSEGVARRITKVGTPELSDSSPR
jgi:arginine repressor